VVPRDGLAIDGDGGARFVVPVDILTVNVEGWGAGDVDAFA